MIWIIILSLNSEKCSVDYWRTITNAFSVLDIFVSIGNQFQPDSEESIPVVSLGVRVRVTEIRVTIWRLRAMLDVGVFPRQITCTSWVSCRFTSAQIPDRSAKLCGKYECIIFGRVQPEQPYVQNWLYLPHTSSVSLESAFDFYRLIPHITNFDLGTWACSIQVPFDKWPTSSVNAPLRFR